MSAVDVAHFITSTQSNGCITDEPDDEDVSVLTSPFPVVFTEDSKLVRTPGPAHPYMVVPSEVRESGSVSTTQDSSRATFVFPTVAIYCQPPSPTISPPRYSRSPSPMQCSPSHCRSPAIEEAAAPVKQPVCARLSVPTDGPLRRRAPAGSLSRSQSHPLHRHHRRSRPEVDGLSSCHQQPERL